MKRIKDTILIISFLLSSFISYSQFISAEIGINGLTCSACSRSVELSLRKLDFVQDVQMNLENTIGTITFKSGAEIDIEKVAKAVINAGFSVRYLNATFKFIGITKVTENDCYESGGYYYQFVKINPTDLKDQLVFKFIGKEFMEGKEFKKWKDDLKSSECNGVKNLYYVTL
ncbi:MAG TPA: heavy metal-associated domain-containing protein [Bacteroidia bacterium]|nr:heavy metal-associated domain-containing protein [Bacteroidia bacterium]